MVEEVEEPDVVEQQADFLVAWMRRHVTVPLMTSQKADVRRLAVKAALFVHMHDVPQGETRLLRALEQRTAADPKAVQDAVLIASAEISRRFMKLVMDAADVRTIGERLNDQG